MLWFGNLKRIFMQFPYRL